MKKTALALIATLVIASTASSRDFAEIFTDCGLGAMIAPNNDAVAAVTNVTWDLGTTAISSNISSPDTCVGGKETSAAFIFQSYESIAADISKGQGDYLNTLLVLAGYAEEDIEQAAIFLREDFAASVANEGYEKMDRFHKAEALYNMLYGASV